MCKAIMLNNNRKLTILYGSQTGTAQDLAEKLYRESKMYHFTGPVLSMDHYDVKELINESTVLFVCSTTGQGEEPDNMKTFWKFLLRKNLPTDSLRGVYFAVLGLGDSSYGKFNFVAKRLNKRLQQLGGHQIIPIGLCDDQHDLGASAVFMPWIDDLWTKLMELSPIPDGKKKLNKIPRQFKWNVTVIDEDKENNSLLKPDHVDIYEGCVDAVFDKPFIGTVLSNVRTTSESHFQDVRLISFSTASVIWNPGDVLVLRPKNDPEKVKELFAIFREHNLGIFPETVVSVKEFDSEMPVPPHLQRPLSLNTVATQYWNLNAVPRQRVFELLALNCENELEKEKLIEFTTPEGQQDLFTYANRPRRTMLEVLHDFRHSTSKLTLPIIFELFEPIKTRSFSIASCKQSEKLDLLVAVVEYKTNLKVPRLGLCSNWLKRLAEGDRIRAVIKKGTLKFPPENAVSPPLVMVGPGTGLAPFRSILQYKQFKWNKTDLMALFFGCRSEKGDFHCKDELKTMQESGLLMLFTAFSRDQEDKIYVQHRIKEQKILLKELLVTQGGWFYLSGNSKDMPQAVKEALTEALDDASYVDHMIKSGRYQEETWA